MRCKFKEAYPYCEARLNLKGYRLLLQKTKMLNIFLSRFSLVVAISTLTLLSVSPTTKAFSLHNEDLDGNLSDNGLNPTVLGELNLGTNSLKATFNAGETNPSPDYFTFTVPEELVLTEIVLQSWETSPEFEDIAFFAIQRGTVFDYVFPNDNLANPAEGLLGWSHLRSTQVGDKEKILLEMSLSNLEPQVSGLKEIYEEEANNNPYSSEQIARLPKDVTEQDLIDSLNNLTGLWASGATGFSLPLEPGDYSLWLRQGSDINVTVELDFNTAKAPVPEPFSIVGIFTAFGWGIMLKRKP